MYSVNRRVNCSPENGRCHKSLIRKVAGGRSPIYDYSRDKGLRQWYYNVPDWFIAYETSPRQLPTKIRFNSYNHAVLSVASSDCLCKLEETPACFACKLPLFAVFSLRPQITVSMFYHDSVLGHFHNNLSVWISIASFLWKYFKAIWFLAMLIRFQLC